MSHEETQIESVFLKALEVQSPEQRALYLNQACAGDDELRRRVERMLAAQPQMGNFLNQNAAQMVLTIDQPTLEKPGSQIGPYKLLQEIGQGGMGVVFMAEQKEPVQRRVALKIIKPGMDTRQVIARFEAERQALSVMDHPNIAKVLDAGTTESGRPYFVMELVKGQPITQYCDEHHLTPRQRLELLLPVCQAIQHAHQKGIIHRDIKPTNILVAEYDNQPVPKVIDFGVAKATSQALTEKTMFTGLGQIVGTLEYMSPEQAKLNQLDIDTRSDIYSLGVLLYELLTGSTPFDKARLRSAAWDEMLRIIREEEPPKPSTRLSDLSSPHARRDAAHGSPLAPREESVTRSVTPTLASIAALRHTEPAKLTKLVRGELDWIVMKALEKDRSRRYETASGLAADLQHYLNDEPVVACPPSAAYRLRKFVRRNKVSVLATSVVLVALIGVAGISLAAAMTYQRMAHENAKLAGDLKSALGDAERNLVQVKEKEKLAQTNLALATAEQQRAEGNLDLALKALDAVYLDAIGTEKLLGSPFGNTTVKFASRQRAPLTDQERQLLLRGLSFYDQFARQNTGTNRAIAQSAIAHKRVGWIHLLLGDKPAADSAFQAAIDRFERLTKQEPENGDYWRQLGLVHQHRADMFPPKDVALKAFKRSINAFTSAIALTPHEASLYIERGRSYHSSDRYLEAAEDFKRADELGPADHWVQVQCAVFFATDEDGRVRDSSKARQCAERAIKLKPNDADSLAAMAETFPLGHDRFIEFYTLALEQSPRNGRCLVRRALGYLVRHESQLGIADATAGIVLNANDANAVALLAKGYTQLGQFEQAASQVERALELDPENYTPWTVKCELELARGDPLQSLAAADRVLRLHPNFSWIYRLKARAHWQLRQYQESLGALRSAEPMPDDLSVLLVIPPVAVAKCPNQEFKDGLLQLADEVVARRPEARRHRAIVAMHLGQWDTAREDISEIIKSGRTDYMSYYQVAMFSLADQNREQYRANCRDMLTKFAESKNSQEIHFTTWTAALAPQALDDYGPTIALAQRGLAINNEGPKAICSLGAILYRAGKYDQAVKTLAPLIAAAERSSPEAKTSAAYPPFFVAMAQHQLGKKDEARAALQKAVELTKAELSDDKNPPAWNRKLTLELLQKEAEDLIGPPVLPDASQAPKDLSKSSATEIPTDRTNR